jgi:hypothetical protein
MVEESKIKEAVEEGVTEVPIIEDKPSILPVHKGLDVGTNLLISSCMGEDGAPVFLLQRDAYFRLVPKSEVNGNAIKMSLEKRKANYIIDSDGSFIVIGDDALEIAIERRSVAERPLMNGVISPKSKKSLPIIKLIIKNLLGGAIPGSKVVYSVPAIPIDSNFDILYHTEIINQYLSSLGYDAQPINEAFAIALSELLDDGLVGVTASFGAGMANCIVIVDGDPLLEFSMTKSGDFIDNSVGRALDISPSLVLQEKEAGTDLFNPKGDIADAICVYYNNVIKYTIENIAYELEKNSKKLPVFKDGIPLVVSGGLALAHGFVQRVEEQLAKTEFPIKISEVRLADSPLTSVANGCLLAAHL